MFKKRTLKGQKKATAPRVDAPAEDTSDALDDAKFAQEARKRARGLSAQALAAPKPTKAEEEAPAPAADTDALGGLGRDFGGGSAGASAAAAVHEKALEEYLAGREASAPAPVPAASRDDALYAAVHKFSTTAHHELHAIDATPVRWRGAPLAVRVSHLSIRSARPPTHWLIYAQVCSPQARGGCPGRLQGRHPRHPWLRRDGHRRGRGGDG